MTERPDEHRQVSSGRASRAAASRLQGALRREVGDLEVRLEEAQLRSNALLHAGLELEAARVLDESREMVDQFHRRLETALAEAAVEREAERILASSGDVVDVLGAGDDDRRGVLSRMPAGVGAAVASLAVLAMAIVTLRVPQERDVRIAGSVAALPSPAASDGDPQAAPDRLAGLSPSLERAVRSFSAAELEVLSEVLEPDTVVPLLERRRRLLDQLAASAQPISATVLAQLDLLVEQLRTEGVDVERLMLLERVEASRADRDRQAPPPGEPSAESPEQPQEPAPSEQPSEQPSPEPTGDDPDGGDDGVFPFDDGGEEPSESDDGGEDGSGASGSDQDSKDDDGGILGN